MIAFLVLLLVGISQVGAGAVGGKFLALQPVSLAATVVSECRSECVEQNLYKIVRVHLQVSGEVPPA